MGKNLSKYIIIFRKQGISFLSFTISYILGYKETAFSHAILAAGITHAVANACRRDKLPKSPCNAGDNPNGYDQNMSRSQRKKFEVITY